MRKFLMAVCLLGSTLNSNAQIFKKPVFSGIYVQWGYNRDWYTKSDLHLTNGSKYDFTLHDAVAGDQPDFEAFTETPLDITIPQNSVRIGVYLNAKHTHAIEINFDHAKYEVRDSQRLRLTGRIGGENIDKDTIIDPYFVHVEHTNGANFLMLNYVGQYELLRNRKRLLASTVWKAGAGIVVPKSYMIVMGKALDNELHVAGYILGIEGGVRFYPLKNLFLEATLKGGYADFFDALTVDGGRLDHHFYYGEIIGLVGYDINFKKKKKN